MMNDDVDDGMKIRIGKNFSRKGEYNEEKTIYFKVMQQSLLKV